MGWVGGAGSRGVAVGHRPLSDMDDCLQAARSGNPKAEIVVELRDEFIEEELEAMRESMDDVSVEAVRSEVEEWSI